MAVQQSAHTPHQDRKEQEERRHLGVHNVRSHFEPDIEANGLDGEPSTVRGILGLSGVIDHGTHTRHCHAASTSVPRIDPDIPRSGRGTFAARAL
jgi:hypothetical protein